MEVRLYNSSLTQSKTYEMAEAKIPLGLVKAEVLTPGGDWIIYEKRNFNNSDNNSGATSFNYRLIKHGQGVVDLGFEAGSVRPINVETKAIHLFAHPGYGGTYAAYTRDDPDITPTFPASYPNGVSALIVIRSTWNIFYEKNFGETQLPTEVQSEYYDSSYRAGVPTDKAQSIRMI